MKRAVFTTSGHHIMIRIRQEKIELETSSGELYL